MQKVSEHFEVPRASLDSRASGSNPCGRCVSRLLAAPEGACQRSVAIGGPVAASTIARSGLGRVA
eukprot:3251286-Pyramimonas_sp.AAC.1